MNKICGIYQIRNLINGRVYIGSSNNFITRWKRHIKDLNTNKHFNPHLQGSWKKYGENKFVFEVVELALKKNLFEVEQFYLDNVVKWKFDYNTARLADKPPSGYGEDNPFSKLKESDILVIMNLYVEEEYTQKEIGDFFGVTQGAIFSVLNGKTWKHIYSGISKELKHKISSISRKKKSSGIGSCREGENCPTSILNEKQVLEIRKLGDKYSQVELASMFNVSRGTIGKILRRETWKHI